MKPQNMDDSNVDLSALAEFHLRAPEIPKNWNSEIPPRGDVLEIRPEWRRLRRHGIGMPEAKRLEKLRIWPPGVASRRGRGGRNSEIQFFKKADAGESSLGVRCRPEADSRARS